MDLNNAHNQSYWFVLREDQNNVIFSTNNFTIQNPQLTGQETRYIVDTGDNPQYIQVNESPPTHDDSSVSCEKKADKQATTEENFWNRDKIKLLLTLCLENKFKNAIKDKLAWSEIAGIVGASPDECNKKYRNLRRTYIRLLKKKRLGKDIKWIHYNICEEVFKDCKTLSVPLLEPWEDSKVRRLLTLYIENLHKFRDPDCLQKNVWKEIAAALGTTQYNCYHKFKNLKRTYFNWLERNRETGKHIKWPYHHYLERIFYNYNPSSGPWDKSKIKQLVDAYTQIAYKFKNPRFLKKELWKEISIIVGESPSSCDRKFRNLKQTYLRLKMRTNAGRSVTKWRYYKEFETIYSNENILRCSDDGVPEFVYKHQEEDYVKQLLTFYIDNKHKFRDPLIKKKHVWRTISPMLGLSSEECDKKFRNLKQTFIRLRERKKETGQCNKWKYYSYFEQIYDEPNTSRGNSDEGETNGYNSLTLSEIRRVMREMQDRHHGDKFDRLIQVVHDSNSIQRERNAILKALIDRR